MQGSQPRETSMDGQSDRWTSVRQHMLSVDLRGRDIRDPRVLQAMAEVPRERFVPPEHRRQAYDDRPLPIGGDQTISQPYIVALMTQVLEVTADCEVLEIGTGSGYQTAILAILAKRVYTVERLAELSQSAQQVLAGLGFDNIEFGIGDGSRGWPQPRVFDRIMVTAAVPLVPQPIQDQLKGGGVLVAPVGSEGVQSLIFCRRTSTGMVQSDLCAVRFVRLVGEHGFRES